MYLKWDNNEELLACNSFLCKLFGFTKWQNCDNLPKLKDGALNSIICTLGNIWFFLFGPNIKTMLVRILFIILLYLISFIIYKSFKNNNKNNEDNDVKGEKILTNFILIMTTIVGSLFIAFVFNLFHKEYILMK